MHIVVRHGEASEIQKRLSQTGTTENIQKRMHSKSPIFKLLAWPTLRMGNLIFLDQNKFFLKKNSQTRGSLKDDHKHRYVIMLQVCNSKTGFEDQSLHEEEEG